MNLSRIVVIVAVTAGVVYAGLTFLLPRGGKPASAQTADAAVAAEAAPATDAAVAPEAAPAEATAAAEAPVDDSTAFAGEDPALTEEEKLNIAANVIGDGAAPAAAAETDTALLDAGAAEPAPEATPEAAPEVAPEAAPEASAEAPVESAAPTAADTEVAASDVDAGSAGLTDEQARRIAANVAREVAAQSGEVIEEAEAAPAPTPTPKPAAKPAPKQEVAAAETPKAAARPASSSSSSSSAASPRKSAPRSKPKAAPSGKVGSGADVISAWWKQSTGSDRLNLVYAGEASSEKAVVLMFDGAVDAAAAGSQIKLIDAKGGTPSGSWTSGNNPRLIAFKGVKPGRYTVIVAAGMADTGGKAVGSELVGPVYVH